MGIKINPPYAIDNTPIYFVKEENGVLGRTNMNGSITINDKVRDPKQLKQIICHEMVHVKQGVRGELTNKLGFQYWKGRKCEKDYWEQPWEKEAYRLQDKLGQYVWENIL